MDKIINVVKVGEDKFLKAINDLEAYIKELNLTAEQADKLLSKTIKYATEASKVAVFYDSESEDDQYFQYLKED